VSHKRPPRTRAHTSLPTSCPHSHTIAHTSLVTCCHGPCTHARPPPTSTTSRGLSRVRASTCLAHGLTRDARLADLICIERMWPHERRTATGHKSSPSHLPSPRPALPSSARSRYPSPEIACAQERCIPPRPKRPRTMRLSPILARLASSVHLPSRRRAEPPGWRRLLTPACATCERPRSRACT